LKLRIVKYYDDKYKSYSHRVERRWLGLWFELRHGVPTLDAALTFVDSYKWEAVAKKHPEVVWESE